MAVFNVSFYNVDPLGLFSTTVGGTTSYTGPSTADGSAVITDTDGVLQDTGSETAIADITIGATTSTGSGVYAEEVWTVRDTVTGEEFQIATLRVETGDATGYYTLSEQPLVPGRVYETVSYDTVPETSAGDDVFTYADYVGPLDGIVEGTSGDDVIDGDYTGDPEGDQVDELDNISELQPTSVHSWADQGVADETSVTGGLSGTTDGIQVDVSILQEANFTEASMETGDTLYDYNAASDSSALYLRGGAAGTDPNALTATIDFSSTDVTLQDEVVDVQFGIFDLDELAGQFIDQVTITAYDAEGNEIPVYITAGDPTTISIVGNTATAIVGSGGGGAATSQSGFIEIYIPGPVAQIVIDYNNIDPAAGNHAIYVGDLTFNAVSVGSNEDVVNAGAGDDYIDAGLASDTMSGETGNDTIVAGVGDDTIYGGADADTIQLDDGFGLDTIEGGETGTDQDVIDATNLTVGTTVTMTGDETGTITDGTSTGTFSEIEGFELTDQSDTYDGTLSTSDQTISGNAGADTITGGSGNDSISGGDDADTIFINDSFGTDSIAGGEGGTDTDTLDASSLTSGVDVVFTGSEAGTLTDGTDTATFAEIENFFLTGSADTFDGSAGSIGVTVFSGDGTDTVIGGSGADSIDSGTGADIVDGGAGSDTINTGDGADTILLSDNFGSDIITAGEGGTDTDTLDASALTAALDILLTGNETGSATDGTDTATFSQVESFVLTDNDDTFDGSAATTAGATVDGGAGDDSIIGTQTDDNLSGGTGQDTIDGGAGDDAISTGDDADTILLTDGFGSDVIFGGEGTSTGGSDNDTLDVSGLTASVNVVLTDDEKGTVSDGTDTASFENIESYVLTGLDDTFDGTAGATPVTVDAGAGDDTLIGGTGADTFYGGTGSDTITLNTGDVATGGGGDDAFIIDTLAGGPLDLTITGGEGDETLGDTLDLQGQVNSASDIVYSGGDNESGTITLIDGSVITFSEIETIFICFAYDTHIMTDRGDRPIQSLEIGDRVITRDHGMQKIRWIGSRKVPAKDNMAPILFKQGVFKNTRDLVVSPQHRMLFQGEQAELMFGQSEVLVPAKQLLGNDGVYQVIDGFVEYFHVLFDNHEIIYAEGSATESYHPGDYSLGEIGEASREEIFNIFPELRSTPNAYGPAARTCLKPHEGRLLKI